MKHGKSSVSGAKALKAAETLVKHERELHGGKKMVSKKEKK